MSDYGPIQSWYWGLNFFEIDHNKWDYLARSNEMELSPMKFFITEKDAIDHWTKLAKSQSWSWERHN